MQGYEERRKQNSKQTFSPQTLASSSLLSTGPRGDEFTPRLRNNKVMPHFPLGSVSGTREN